MCWFCKRDCRPNGLPGGLLYDDPANAWFLTHAWFAAHSFQATARKYVSSEPGTGLGDVLAAWPNNRALVLARSLPENFRDRAAKAIKEAQPERAPPGTPPIDWSGACERLQLLSRLAILPEPSDCAQLENASLVLKCHTDDLNSLMEGFTELQPVLLERLAERHGVKSAVLKEAGLLDKWPRKIEECKRRGVEAVVKRMVRWQKGLKVLADNKCAAAVLRFIRFALCLVCVL